MSFRGILLNSWSSETRFSRLFVNPIETHGAAGIGLGKKELRRKPRAEQRRGSSQEPEPFGGGVGGWGKDAPEIQLCRPTKQYFSLDPVLHFGHSWLSLLRRVYFVTETIY